MTTKKTKPDKRFWRTMETFEQIATREPVDPGDIISKLHAKDLMSAGLVTHNPEGNYVLTLKGHDVWFHWQRVGKPAVKSDDVPDVDAYLCYYELHAENLTFHVHEIIEAESWSAASDKMARKVTGDGWDLQPKGVVGKVCYPTVMQYLKDGVRSKFLRTDATARLLEEQNEQAEKQTVKLDTTPENQIGPVVMGRLTHTKDGYAILLDQSVENLRQLVRAYRDGAGTDLMQRDSHVTLAFTAHINDMAQLAVEVDPQTTPAQKSINSMAMVLLKHHKQLEVAVQDLLVDLKIGPEDLRHISRYGCEDDAGISPKTAQKLLDVGVALLSGKPEKISCCPICGADGLGDRDGRHHCSDPECMLHLTRFSPNDWAKTKRKLNMNRYRKSVTPEARERILNKLKENPSLYRRELVPDEKCVWNNPQEEFRPLAIFKNENGSVIQIVVDDKQLIAAVKIPNGKYKVTPWIPREVAQHFTYLRRDLEAIEKYSRKKTQNA